MKGGPLRHIPETAETPQTDLEERSQDADKVYSDSEQDSEETDLRSESSVISENEMSHDNVSTTESLIVNMGSQAPNTVVTEEDTSCPHNPDLEPLEKLSIINYKKWKVNAIQQASPAFLVINTIINGLEVRSMLDTGASISLMTETTAKVLNLEINHKERNCIYGIGGKDTQTRTLGTVTATVCIHKLKFPIVHFHVVNDSCIDEPVFLGYDFLTMYGLTVNVYRKCIKYVDTMNNSQWDLYLFPEGYKLIVHRMICRAASSIKFDPMINEQVHIPISIDYPEYVIPDIL